MHTLRFFKMDCSLQRRRSPFAAWLAGFFLTLAAPGIAGAADADVTRQSPRIEVVGMPAARGAKPEVLAAWTHFADRWIAAWKATDPARSTSEADAERRFQLDVAARSQLARHWAEQRKVHPGYRDAYLDVLADLERAGLVEELVIAEIAPAGWRVPQVARPHLDWSAWRKARAELPRDFKADPGYLTILVDGVPWVNSAEGLSVPGDSLVADVRRLHDDPNRCRFQVEYRGLVRRWLAEQGALVGRLVVVASSTDVAAVFQDLPDAASPTTSVVLGSDVPLWLYFDAGFCAVERGDANEAVEMLSAGERLSPGWPRLRSELLAAYNHAHRYHESLAAADRFLSQVTNPCDAARMLRYKAFALVDLGQWQAARQALQQSLQIEPENAVGKHELAFVEEAMRKAGGQAPAAPGAPPPSQLTYSKCTVEK